MQGPQREVGDPWWAPQPNVQTPPLSVCATAVIATTISTVEREVGNKTRIKNNSSVLHSWKQSGYEHKPNRVPPLLQAPLIPNAVSHFWSGRRRGSSRSGPPPKNTLPLFLRALAGWSSGTVKGLSLWSVLPRGLKECGLGLCSVHFLLRAWCFVRVCCHTLGIFKTIVHAHRGNYEVVQKNNVDVFINPENK